MSLCDNFKERSEATKIQTMNRRLKRMISDLLTFLFMFYEMKHTRTAS